MGFPSPAQDYTESRISLDGLCNTNRPSVYLFKADSDSSQDGIKKGALLVVNRDSKPSDGSIIAATIGGSFRLVRYRTVPQIHLQELNHPGRRLALTDSEASDEEGICFGVITHVLNDVRVLDS
jgi:DNA polymerase V